MREMTWANCEVCRRVQKIITLKHRAEDLGRRMECREISGRALSGAVAAAALRREAHT
jgi:hypothetical protein